MTRALRWFNATSFLVRDPNFIGSAIPDYVTGYVKIVRNSGPHETREFRIYGSPVSVTSCGPLPFNASGIALIRQTLTSWQSTDPQTIFESFCASRSSAGLRSHGSRWTFKRLKLFVLAIARFKAISSSPSVRTSSPSPAPRTSGIL